MEIPLRAQCIGIVMVSAFRAGKNMPKALRRWGLEAALQDVCDKQRLALDQGEQDEGRAGRSPTALLPVAEGFDRDAERLGKRALGLSDAAGAFPNRGHVNAVRPFHEPSSLA